MLRVLGACSFLDFFLPVPACIYISTSHLISLLRIYCAFSLTHNLSPNFPDPRHTSVVSYFDRIRPWIF